MFYDTCTPEIADICCTHVTLWMAMMTIKVLDGDDDNLQLSWEAKLYTLCIQCVDQVKQTFADHAKTKQGVGAHPLPGPRLVCNMVCAGSTPGLNLVYNCVSHESASSELP